MPRTPLAKLPRGTHGGPRPGAGRPPLHEEGAASVVSLRVSEAQMDRFYELGGADWLRRTLERAPTPKRPPTRGSDDALRRLTVRLVPSQRERLSELGGAAWLRAVLDRSISAVRALRAGER